MSLTMDADTHGKENMHCMQVPTSPSFLKPKPIKLRKRPKRLVASPLVDLDINSNENKSGFSFKSSRTLINPFRCESKRKRIEDNEDSNSLLWKRTNLLQQNAYEEPKVLPSPVIASALDENANSAFSEIIAPLSASKVKTKQDKQTTKEIPFDWSVKTKIRFTSPLPFPSRGSFRTFEEVNGTIGFVRCLHSNEDVTKSNIHSSYGSRFFQQCLVWMHPSLPWLKLFPRTDDKFVKSNNPSIAIDSNTQETLHSAWCDSFRSLYQLVRLFQCPYFYMCAPTFTVMFRCAGAASIPVIHAMISPTTKGFRKSLKDEGIVFTMPLNRFKDSDSVNELAEDSPDLVESDSVPKMECEENDIDDDVTWLESLGLSQDDFPSLNKRKPQIEESRKIDHKPESLIYVEDSETQGLVNFLLNSQLCVAKFGPMAGIPPTLLAPTAFLGGTLQSLKIRHGKVKVDKKELDSVEINGPLLPNAIHSLCSLFNATQNGQFSSALTSFIPSVAFSMVIPQSPILPCIFAQNNVADCGFPSEFVEKMCSKPEESILTSINAENGYFSWK